MKKQQDGYILVLSLIILGLVTIIGSQLFYLGSNFSSYVHVSVHREHAKVLALSGVRIAQAQLFVPADEKQATKEESPDDGKAKEKETVKKDGAHQELQLLRRVLPLLNKWHTISFTREKDGVEGTLQTYLACEDGKIDLNNTLSLMTKKDLTPAHKELFTLLFQRISDLVGARIDLFAAAFDFFERRNFAWLNDITELLSDSGFKVFENRIFMPRPTRERERERKSETCLTDIFTHQSRYAKLEPWMFSASTIAILGLKTPVVSKDVLEKIVQEGKVKFDWKKDWDMYLKPLYGVEFNALPKNIDVMLAPQLYPRSFSVVSYAVVRDVVQGVYAVFARKTDPHGSIVFVPEKIYWI
jgi:hypothetical protein